MKVLVVVVGAVAASVANLSHLARKSADWSGGPADATAIGRAPGGAARASSGSRTARGGAAVGGGRERTS